MMGFRDPLQPEAQVRRTAEGPADLFVDDASLPANDEAGKPHLDARWDGVRKEFEGKNEDVRRAHKRLALSVKRLMSALAENESIAARTALGNTSQYLSDNQQALTAASKSFPIENGALILELSQSYLRNVKVAIDNWSQMLKADNRAQATMVNSALHSLRVAAQLRLSFVERHVNAILEVKGDEQAENEPKNESPNWRETVAIVVERIWQENDADAAIQSVSEPLSAFRLSKLQAIARLAIAHQQFEEASRARNEMVDEARDIGASWADIGEATNVDRATAIRRWDAAAQRKHREYQANRRRADGRS